VTRDGKRLVMDFPAHELKPVDNPPQALVAGLRGSPSELYAVTTDDNYFAVFDDEDDVRALAPDFARLETLHPAGVVATAPGHDSDCASRYFAPSYGIPEDPVTGSIHCGLAPYWASRLGRHRIHARQVSARGGELYCEDRGDRVTIAGHAVKYMQGTIRF
jgi:predicted PhzF superfamily epimerase YddE/YHI9